MIYGVFSQIYFVVIHVFFAQICFTLPNKMTFRNSECEKNKLCTPEMSLLIFVLPFWIKSVLNLASYSTQICSWGSWSACLFCCCGQLQLYNWDLSLSEVSLENDVHGHDGSVVPHGAGREKLPQLWDGDGSQEGWFGKTSIEIRF